MKSKSTETKPGIVFAHGIWADGSCFQKLIPTLRAEGHEVMAAQYGLDTLKGDVDATIRCSSGTYIRALARDLGATLGTGGHLTRLRRTRVGGYRIEDARTLEQLAGRFEVLPLAQAAAAAFPSRTLTADEAHRLAHGGRLAATAAVGPTAAGPSAAYAPDGTLIALVTEESGQARPLVVFA